MKFSLIRLSTRQSTGRIPRCQRVDDRSSALPEYLACRSDSRVPHGQPTTSCEARRRCTRVVSLIEAFPRRSPLVTHTWLQALRSDGLCCSVVHRYYALLRLPLGSPPLHRLAAYRFRRYRAPGRGAPQPCYAGAETDLSCSATDCAAIPPSLPRRVHRRCDLQGLRAVHGLRPVKRGSAPALSPCRGCKVPHRTDWLLARPPEGLCRDASTVGSPLPPATSYRAAWPLPGPDLHRQARRSFQDTLSLMGVAAGPRWWLGCAVR